MGTSWKIATSSVVLISLLVVGSSQIIDNFQDLQGPYCSEIGCCLNRTDSCSKPVIGTLCYCDEFCDRHLNQDCCPDFWAVCKGITTTTTKPFTTTRPPPEELKVCTYNGVQYPLYAEIRDNCNSCKCELTGDNPVVRCDQNVCLISPEIIYDVNMNNRQTWTASNYSKFWGRTLADGVRYRLGTTKPHKNVMSMNSVKRYYDPYSLPKRFDSNENWPRYIVGVRDQGWCGSSWAVSTAAIASDRFGIMSEGFESVNLSPQNIISCARGSNGCEAGPLDRAWTYVRKYGVVDEDCFSYSGASLPRCHIRRTASLVSANCTLPRNSDRTELYKVGPAYKLGNETDIMYDILRSGPVQATMRVYHDFFSYAGGIYRHTDLSLSHQQGYHSVRIVGWGEEITSLGFQKYWKVANSWGTDWGEDGYFRIVRGSNECEIESFVLGVWAKVDDKFTKRFFRK